MKMTSVLDFMNKFEKIKISKNQTNQWSLENCKSLLSIMKKSKDSNGLQYIGSITFKNYHGSAIVIDGERWLTIIQLLLIAIYNNAEESKKIVEIKDQYLLASDKTNKIVLGKNESETFEMLLNNPSAIDNAKASKILKCYSYFCEILKDEGVVIIYDLLNHLGIIPVEIKDDTFGFENIINNNDTVEDSSESEKNVTVNYTLADNLDDIHERKVYKLEFKNKRIPVANWSELYKEVIKRLYASYNWLKQDLLRKAGEEKKLKDIRNFFNEDGAGFPRCFEIDSHFYGSLHTKTIEKLLLLRRIFDLVGVNYSELKFDVDGSKKKYGFRGDTRIVNLADYWTDALPIIKAKHNNVCFAKCMPNKYNSKSASFKITKFVIRCNASSPITVELQLARPDKADNEYAFNLLKSKKEDIEAEIGYPLIWQKDESKSRKIYTMLENVDITNKEDWEKIAEFHAEVSKKFYDVFVPELLAMKKEKGW